MSIPKKDVRYRLVHTIPEAMVLLHISDRGQFIKEYIDTGLVGIFDRNKVLRVDLERAIKAKTFYKIPKEFKK